MSASKKIFKKIGMIILIVFILIQFIHPAKNLSAEKSKSISVKYSVPENVSQILDAACNDCHSNKTVYPWYTNIQPVDWFMAKHVNDGKRHLNFDEFLSYRPYKQNHKLEEIDEVLAEGEMPLNSYTWMHPKAKLKPEEKEILIKWSKDLRDSMANEYPADSLVMPKRK